MSNSTPETLLSTETPKNTLAKKGCTVREIVAALQKLRNQDAIVYTHDSILYDTMINIQNISWDGKNYAVDHKTNNGVIDEENKVYNGVYFESPDDVCHRYLCDYYPLHIIDLFNNCRKLLLSMDKASVSVTEVVNFISRELRSFNRVIYFFPDTMHIVDSKSETDPLTSQFAKADFSPLFTVHSDLIWISKIPYATFSSFIQNPIKWLANTVPEPEAKIETSSLTTESYRESTEQPVTETVKIVKKE